MSSFALFFEVGLRGKWEYPQSSVLRSSPYGIDVISLGLIFEALGSAASLNREETRENRGHDAI